MTHGPSARSRRRTRCPTSSRWAVGSSSRSRSRRFPRTCPARTLTEIFAGASAKVREAGGTLAGGHTIRDAEPKYGLAVIGAAHPGRLLRKGGAKPGDRLVLTKRLGTGVLLSGSRAGRTSENDLTGAIELMRGLNQAAAEVLVNARGRRRHRCHRLRPARPRPRDGSCLRDPFRLPGGRATCASGRAGARCAGIETGGAAHNRRYVAGSLTVGSGVAPELVALAHDPQTSGGLLAAIPPADATNVQGRARRTRGRALVDRRGHPGRRVK